MATPSSSRARTGPPTGIGNQPQAFWAQYAPDQDAVQCVLSGRVVPRLYESRGLRAVLFGLRSASGAR